jgi:hypothetical protein
MSTPALLAVCCLARHMWERWRIWCPSTTYTATRVQRTVVVGLDLEIFARGRGKIGCGDRRRRRTLRKATERLKYLSVPRGMFNAPEHFGVLCFVFRATSSLLTLESVEFVGCYT